MNDQRERQPSAGATVPDFYTETVEEVADLQAPTVPTPEARRAAMPEEPDQDFGTLWSKSVERDWISSGVSRVWDAPEYEADPDFSVDRRGIMTP